METEENQTLANQQSPALAEAKSPPQNLSQKEEMIEALFSEMLLMRAIARLRTLAVMSLQEISSLLQQMQVVAKHRLQRGSVESEGLEIFFSLKKQISALIDGQMGKHAPGAKVQWSQIWARGYYKGFIERQESTLELREQGSSQVKKNEQSSISCSHIGEQDLCDLLSWFSNPPAGAHSAVTTRMKTKSQEIFKSIACGNYPKDSFIFQSRGPWPSVLSVLLQSRCNLTTFYGCEGFDRYSPVSSTCEDQGSHKALVKPETLSVSYHCQRYLSLNSSYLELSAFLKQIDHPKYKDSETQYKKHNALAVIELESSSALYQSQYHEASLKIPGHDGPHKAQLLLLTGTIKKALFRMQEHKGGQMQQALQQFFEQSSHESACFLLCTKDPHQLNLESRPLCVIAQNRPANNLGDHLMHRSGFWCLLSDKTGQYAYDRIFVTEEEKQLRRTLEKKAVPYHKKKPQSEAESALWRVSDLFDCMCTIDTESEAVCALEVIGESLAKIEALSEDVAQGQRELLSRFRLKSEQYCHLQQEGKKQN